ncbi:diacylglycerol kinase [Thiolapillus brandeum]|uniref:Diacylglycerol kinase n=1 Tax=Thiolapillus brandeum TaxID=1076588 RepID=A0A7U6GGC1_9GAMM|nr:diacylglycerol kinase [Thiolapillus brandeum]BAO43079.1 diacylglycerol kinase [Thiolapillus brandeum]
MSAGKPGNTGFTRLIKAFGYSMKGFSSCFRSEAAFRQEAAASLLIIPLALWLGQTGVERALLLGSWLLVPLMEMLNSAIEAVVDRIGSEQHPLSGQAKDIGSAAVFLAICLFLCVWGLILLPHFIS